MKLIHSSQFHASSVAYDGRAVVIFGPSGSGKTWLTLELMSRGAILIGDDQIFVKKIDGQLWAEPHPNAATRLEVRDVGIYQAAEFSERARLTLCVSLGEVASSRLPNAQFWTFEGISIPKISGKDVKSLAPFVHLVMTERLWKWNVT